MANMQATKTPMPEQDPNVRNKNFEEVALGYTVEMAVDEANRCLNCPRPACMSGCPVNVQIPDFIALIASGDFEGAYQKIGETNALPAVCGRVCPQENQCQAVCVRGKKGESVAIGRLERFVADWHRAQQEPKVPSRAEEKGKKVAVVGSGPAGLACAGELARMGYSVTVFEALHTPGGVLAYGIPAFRLPKDILHEEIAGLEKLGLIEPIRQKAAAGTPLLGICLGMQMLFDESEEFGLHKGLGLIPGRVVKIPGTDADGCPQRVPHISWEPLYPGGGRADFAGTALAQLRAGEECYFIHSYEAKPLQDADCLAYTTYGGRQICAAATHGSVLGCQFHPEKSGEVGLKIIEEFLKSAER